MAPAFTPKIHVLIVDDHAEVRQGIRDLLCQGFPDLQVETVPDAERALRRVGEHRFDIVLMDVALPGMGGLDAIRRMRPLQPLAQFLVVSVHEGRVVRDGAMAVGAAGFVAKRHLHDELLHSVGDLLQRREQSPCLSARRGGP